MGSPGQEQALRSALFSICETKEHLHKWIKVYLGLDLPNAIVCSDDIKYTPSNSCPMDLVWEVYSKALKGDDPDFTQILAVSAREGMKTLDMSIIEVLALLHLDRDVGHLAALEVQAKYCQQYVTNFFKRPILREFLVSRNKRTLEICKYINDDTGEIISPIQWQSIPEDEKTKFTERINTMQILVATVESCNGLHVPILVIDEAELTDKAAFEEAKMIPVTTRDGKLPITIYTSTRKYSFGNVQNEIDRAPETGLNIRFWNLIDVTEPCPPERHLPEEPKISVYYSDETLKAISQEDWSKLPDNEKDRYELGTGYAGCLSKCKIYASCKARLATQQKSKSLLLKKLWHTQSAMSKVSLETALAQYLCRKPSAEGLVYPNFSREIHMLSPAQMARRITGEPFDERSFSRNDLIDLLISLGAQFFSGLDWGFTHNFAVVTAALIGHTLYIIDVIAASGLELQQTVALTKERIGRLKPTIYPDNAYPANVKTFRSSGFRMVDFKKEVVGGIDAVRTRMSPGSGFPPSLFLLRGDPGCEGLSQRLSKYHWKIDKSTGMLSDEPDQEKSDELDACRYLCQNVPLNKKSLLVANDKKDPNSLYKEDPNKNWMKQKIREITGNNSEEDEGLQGEENGIQWWF
jgi:hypothetical protein